MPTVKGDCISILKKITPAIHKMQVCKNSINFVFFLIFLFFTHLQKLNIMKLKNMI